MLNEHWAALTYPPQLCGRSLEMAFGLAPAPTGWHVIDRCCCLGNGREVFERAWLRLCNWEMHNATPAKVGKVAPAAIGQVVTISFLQTSSPCLVTHLVDTPNVKALVYGTLPGHVECGEEAFIITFDECTGQVWGRCIAFSSTRWWLARLGEPVARKTQHWMAGKYLTALM